MAGLFDFMGNDGGGLLGISGRGLSPQQQQILFEREMFMNQLREQMGNNPNMPMGQALYNIQHPEIQYGMPQAAGSAKINNVEVPIYRGPHGEYSTPFGSLGGNNVPQPVGQATAPQNAGGTALPNATPGQGGSAGPLQGLQPLIDWSTQNKAQEAGAVKRAETAAQGAPSFPAALSEAHQRIAQLIAIRDHPNLEKVVGRFAGATPAQYSADPDLVSSIDTANAALKGQTFQTIRAPSGRPISPGAIKEMAIGDLSESRRGTAEGMRSEINRIIGQIQKETEASWEGVNSPPEYKPVWGKNETPQSSEAGSAPNDRAVQFLRAHPEHSDQFDAKFGQGASQRVLGNAQRL